jgi:cystathionine gamma-synthase
VLQRVQKRVHRSEPIDGQRAIPEHRIALMGFLAVTFTSKPSTILNWTPILSSGRLRLEGTKYTRGAEQPDPETGAIETPIYQTVSYIHPKGERFRYTREANPTVATLSQKVALLEEFEAGTSFSSGMAAITTALLALLSPGATLVTQKDGFGRSVRFAKDFLARWGVKVRVTPSETDTIISEIEDGCSVVFVESVTNPCLRVVDLERLAESAHNGGALLVVDNTLATTYNFKPSKFGADLVIHSASKFLAGHNDVVAGVAAGKKELVLRLDELRKTLGCSLDPHAAHLVIRGIKTLHVRMERINANALAIAQSLQANPRVGGVIYPGLDNHPDHAVAKRLMSGYGGVLSFYLNTSDKNAYLTFMKSLRLVYPANTLGATETIVSHPATMSHRGLTEEERREIGINWQLMRLSVGLEEKEDILSDLESALASL